MAGPKYPKVEAKNAYQPTGDKKTGDKVMTGPVYPNVDSSNKVPLSFFLLFISFNHF